jgi:23S rRNA-/tRNA-specific pseudouridylate synthase
LEEFLLSTENFGSMSAVKRHLRRRLVYVNGLCVRSSTDPVICGDVVEVVERISQNIPHIPPGGSCGVPVHWEDDYCAVVEKPFNVPIFSGGSNFAGNPLSNNASLHTALLHSLRPLSPGVESPLHRPQCVHRLDVLTGGLVVVAKTRPALVALTDMFAGRQVEKKYLAIVAGMLDGAGDIVCPIQGKFAHSRFRVVRHDSSVQFGAISTVEVTLLTGRTHQIRIHLNSVGHPIIGDPLHTASPLVSSQVSYSEFTQVRGTTTITTTSV